MSLFRRPTAYVAATIVLFLSGCSAATVAQSPSNPAAPAAVEMDNCGTMISFAAPPERIVAVKSSSLELLLALGASEKIVGAAFLDGPLPDSLADQGAKVPILSERLPSREAVLEVEPDLIFAGWESNFSSDGVGERTSLEKLGVGTYVAPAACTALGYKPDPLTFDHVFDGFVELGEIIDEGQAAKALVDEQAAELAAIVPDKRNLSTVWYSSGKDQPFVGAGLGAPEMIMSAAGLNNVFADVDDSWASTSWESVAQANPDVIVLVDATWNTAAAKVDLLQANPVTAHLDAVRMNRYIIVDFPATEAGVRSVDAVTAIVDQLSSL